MLAGVGDARERAHQARTGPMARPSTMGNGRHRLARLHALARAVVPLWENSRTARVGFHARRAAVVLLRVGF